MASSLNHITLLFLLFAISSFQVHARDNQLFSKFHHTSINNAKETKVVPQTDMTSGTQGDDQPSNPVKETYNGYGLYGRGTDQFPTTTNEASLTSSSLTKKMPSDEFYNDQSFEFNDNNNNKVNKNYGEEPKQYGLSDTRYQDNTNYYYNNNNNNVNKNREEPKQYGLSDTRYQDNTNYYYNNNNNNVNKNREEAKQYSFSDTRYQDNSNNNNDNYYYYRNNNNNNNNNNQNNNGYPVVKQQGMSDTRFVENGKYYYDVNNEINFDPNEYHFRGMNMNLRNKYNNNGAYNGNNEMDSYQEDVQNEKTQQEFLP